MAFVASRPRDSKESRERGTGLLWLIQLGFFAAVTCCSGTFPGRPVSKKSRGRIRIRKMEHRQVRLSASLSVGWQSVP